MVRDAADSPSLNRILDGDPQRWLAALDDRYAVLDEVLAGRRRAIVYPAARLGRAAASRLRSRGVDVVAFGDGDPSRRGRSIDGVPVLSPVEISASHRADVILVATTLHDSTIREDLAARGCEHVVPVGYLNLRLPDIFPAREYDGAWRAAADPNNRVEIESAYSLLADDASRRTFEGKIAYYLSLEKPYLDGVRTSDPIYFDRTVYELDDDEVVVDGGAFVGDTLSSFRTITHGRFRSYFAFEPDPSSFALLAESVAGDAARITVIEAGLAARTSTARFLSTQGADSRLLGGDEAGGNGVPVVALDDYFDGRPGPSLIKMDIEGAESDALHGAAGLLRTATPTLAISAYHLPTDLWTIPLLLSRLMAGSRVYLRHYTREVDDTVCYAVPDGRRIPRPS